MINIMRNSSLNMKSPSYQEYKKRFTLTNIGLCSNSVKKSIQSDLSFQLESSSDSKGDPADLLSAEYFQQICICIDFRG
jgi:hypothetical protein